MKMIRKILRLSCIMMLEGLLLMSSCEADLEPEGKNDPNNQVNPAAVDPDEAIEYLVRDNANQFTGDLQVAPDSQLKMNFKDTIYVVKGLTYGARVVVRHDGMYDITGFYVTVPNDSSYYDIPVEEAEAQDSSDVIYIHAALPENNKYDYLFTIPLIIQSHGPGGDPIDEFNKWVTIEDSEQDHECPITVLRDPPWEWEFTLGNNYAGEVQIDAPGLKKISSYQTGGCCNDGGTSTTVANDPYCTQNSVNFRPIDVEHYFQWDFDLLYLYEDGTFKHYNASRQTNYRPSLSDFCNNIAAYDHVSNEFTKYGTHDFSPAADHLNITYNVADPPVFGKIIGSGEIIYTCHSLILTVGFEEKWSIVYRKLVHDHDPKAFATWD